MQKLPLGCPTAALLHSFRHCAQPLPAANTRPSESFSVYTAATDVPLMDWYSIVTPEQLLMRAPYLTALETAQRSQMETRYAIVYEYGHPVVFAYFQLLPFGGKIAQAAQLGSKRLVNFIACNAKNKWLLLCGNACMTGIRGYVHSPEISEEKAQAYVLQLMEHMAKQDARIAAFSLKDIAAQAQRPARMHTIPTEPCMELALSPCWRTFADYLAAMESKYRQRANSAMKKSAEVSVSELSAEDIAAHEHRLMQLLGNVIRDDTFNIMETKCGYFAALKNRLQADFRLYAYWHEGELVAFRSSLYRGTVLDAHFVGYELSLNHDLKLYQRLLYDTVKESIEAIGISHISFGRTATEIKSTLGALPVEYASWVRFTSPPLNALVGQALKRLQLPEYTLRHPFKEQPAPVATVHAAV